MLLFQVNAGEVRTDLGILVVIAPAGDLDAQALGDAANTLLDSEKGQNKHRNELKRPWGNAGDRNMRRAMADRIVCLDGT